MSQTTPAAETLTRPRTAFEARQAVLAMFDVANASETVQERAERFLDELEAALVEEQRVKYAGLDSRLLNSIREELGCVEALEKHADTVRGTLEALAHVFHRAEGADDDEHFAWGALEGLALGARDAANLIYCAATSFSEAEQDYQDLKRSPATGDACKGFE